MTASANWISGPSMGALLFREGAGRWPWRSSMEALGSLIVQRSGVHYRGPDGPGGAVGRAVVRVLVVRVVPVVLVVRRCWSCGRAAGGAGPTWDQPGPWR